MTATRNDLGENSSLEHYAAKQANFASIVTAAMGVATVIVLFGVVVLISCYAQGAYRKILSDLIAVQGSTAAGCVLAGAALYMQCVNVSQPSRKLTISAHVAAALLMLLGAEFLAQSYFGVDLTGFRIPGLAVSGDIVGSRIHPLAAGGFMLIAMTLLALDLRLRGGHYPAEYLALTLIAVSAVPFVGYMYGVSKLTFLLCPAGVPFLTALAFLSVGAALLMARPSHRLMSTIISHAPGGNMLRRLLPSLLFLIVILNLLVARGAELGLYSDQLKLPVLTLIDGALVIFAFWRFAGKLDREYGARMQSAAKLAEANSLLNAVSDSTREPIFVKNRQGLLIFANPALLQQVGKTWEEAMYRSNRELFRQEDFRKIDEDDHRVMATGLPETIEQTLHLPHGNFTYQSTRVPWFDKNGNVLGVIGISTDISERKRAEDSLRQREAQLEKTVVERTALLRELTNHLETVREEEKRAIARELHDNMGASLTALSMHLESVYKILPDDEKWRERKPRMQVLMNSLVSTTRRIQTELRPNMLDLFGLKAAITEQLDELAERSGIACHISLPDEDVTIGHQMEIAIYRMLQEMLNNVTKHAQASQIDVVLDVDEEQVSLTVRDNGIGIPLERQENNKTYGLRGLRERATFFGGKVTIRSMPGAGTTMTIRLPLSPETAV